MNAIERILDFVRERKITWHKTMMLSAEASRRRHHDAFMRLLKGRSARQVERMERERGLL